MCQAANAETRPDAVLWTAGDDLATPSQSPDRSAPRWAAVEMSTRADPEGLQERHTMPPVLGLKNSSRSLVPQSAHSASDGVPKGQQQRCGHGERLNQRAQRGLPPTGPVAGLGKRDSQ